LEPKNRKTLIVIAGPTAVGKTAVAIKLAHHFQTEIISADSRQIFRELTIGTAKPTVEELKMVPHHFINSHSINDEYDAAQYGRDALVLINKLFEAHDTLILCGGSGLYIKAVSEGFDDIPEIPENIREELVARYEQHGLPWLQNKMQELDPDHFQTIDQKNPHRLIRAIEVWLATGKSIASFRSHSRISHSFDIIKIGLEMEREELYQRIDARMDQMIERGLFEEASALYPQRSRQALQTVGYKEIFDFMDGKYEREEAIRLLKRNTRHYAKRQLTWFKRDTEMHWFFPGEVEKMIALIQSKKSQMS
jgi:tRNA dimethylallyltransferase